MHAVLALEVAVGVFALEFERAGLYTYLLASLIVEHLDLVSVRLAPAGVHAQQHPRPVERLGTARTGIDIHDSAHTVLVTAQHVAQFEFLDAVHRTRVLFVELLLGHHALLDEFRHQPQVLDLLDHSIVLLDPRLDSRHAAQLFAGLVGIIPKARNLRLLLLVLEFYSSLVDVKDTSPTYPDVL